MLSNQLCNPTPFLVRINWDKGVDIVIKPDGHYILPNHQLVDFQPGQPGSEAVQMLMNDHGIFLRDQDQTYEAQALKAIVACRRSKNSHFEESTNNLRRSRAAAGIVDNPEALEETFRQLGLMTLRDQVKRLDFRIKQLEAEVAGQKTAVAKDNFDPDRTLIFVDPPKVFETKFALQMFLAESENSALKKQYDAWRKAMTKSATAESA
jgi:hypothetical protein